MSAEVDYRELERLVSDQARVHGTDYYQNAPTRTQSIYDQTIRMGKSILEERGENQLAPQTMVDMTVQSINVAIKALKSNATVATNTQPDSGQSPQEARPGQAAGPVASRGGDQSPVGAAAQASTATRGVQRSTDEPPAPQTAAEESAPESAVQPTAPTGEDAEPTLPTTVTVATTPAETPQPTTAPEEVSASTQPTVAEVSTEPTAAFETTANSNRKPSPVSGSSSSRQRSDEEAVTRQSVSRAIWRGLQWTLGFRKKNEDK
ncbi:hypothetical protein [uncultured Limosilactobacillus sp.]|uniref:hypothetical protein n=1 Tax=uncultured Limosilactobacillus sp. TaxID=2837629 RepID=UPI0025937D18|nr:hypothetical protein [uncultured Limosilactobacillus sp.]